MVNSRTKGHNNERRLANLYKRCFPDAKRNYQSRGQDSDGADLQGVPFWVEAKHYCKLRHGDLYSWVERLPSSLAALHVKCDREAPLVVLRESDWMRIVSLLEGTRSKDSKGPWESWAEQ